MGAAQYAKTSTNASKITHEQVQTAIDELEEPFQTGKSVNPYDLQKELNHIMSTYVGIFRDEKDLSTAVEKLSELSTKIKNVSADPNKAYNPGWHLCRDLKNMLICSQAITRSALIRKESRGAHSRLDYPELNARARQSQYFSFQTKRRDEN